MRPTSPGQGTRPIARARFGRPGALTGRPTPIPPARSSEARILALKQFTAIVHHGEPAEMTAFASRPSRSDELTVAVGFSPRRKPPHVPASRSDACAVSEGNGFHRRSATWPSRPPLRGLKLTATLTASLRDGRKPRCVHSMASATPSIDCPWPPCHRIARTICRQSHRTLNC
jgi:hypothetical protein